MPLGPLRLALMLALLLPPAAAQSSLAATDPNPRPALTAISPALTVRAPATTVTITGSGFVPSSIVRWNGSNRWTTSVSSTIIRATIPASDLAVAATAQVSVFTPAPGGGSSDRLPVPIVDMTVLKPVPFVSGLSFPLEFVQNPAD